MSTAKAVEAMPVDLDVQMNFQRKSSDLPPARTPNEVSEDLLETFIAIEKEVMGEIIGDPGYWGTPMIQMAIRLRENLITSVDQNKAIANMYTETQGRESMSPFIIILDEEYCKMHDDVIRPRILKRLKIAKNLEARKGELVLTKVEDQAWKDLRKTIKWFKCQLNEQGTLELGIPSQDFDMISQSVQFSFNIAIQLSSSKIKIEDLLPKDRAIIEGGLYINQSIRDTLEKSNLILERKLKSVKKVIVDSCDDCLANKQLIFALKSFAWKAVDRPASEEDNIIYRVIEEGIYPVTFGKRIKDTRAFVVRNLEGRQGLIKKGTKVEKICAGMTLRIRGDFGDKNVWYKNDDSWQQIKLHKRALNFKEICVIWDQDNIYRKIDFQVNLDAVEKKSGETGIVLKSMVTRRIFQTHTHLEDMTARVTAGRYRNQIPETYTINKFRKKMYGDGTKMKRGYIPPVREREREGIGNSMLLEETP